jgi:hypothetical protein
MSRSSVAQVEPSALAVQRLARKWGWDSTAEDVAALRKHLRERKRVVAVSRAQEDQP